MDLTNFFGRNQVIKLKETEKQLVIKELVEKLDSLSLIENKNRYYAQVVHRESLENTGIGHGIAIPHARTESVSDFISILGVSEQGIDYQSYDDEPVNYILLSIFPAGLSTTYLYLVGMMARIFSNPEKKKLLDEEKDPKKLYTLLKKESDAYFDTISEKEKLEAQNTEALTGVPSSDLDQLIRLDRLYQLLEENKKKDIISKKIEKIQTLIDNRSLTYYERMRKRKSNPFAIVEKDSCSGCHMGIPPIYLKQVKAREGIPVCTHCGRFLIIV